MYFTKDSTKEAVVAYVANEIAELHNFVEFFREWMYRRSVPSEVEEHLLRAVAELQAALALLVHPIERDDSGNNT